MACWQNGMSLSLWSFVAPHGVLELPAIFIAGGAGLLLARGLLFPGWLPRREALRRSAAEAGRLVLGIFPLLVVAGTTEGFFSPPTSLLAEVHLGRDDVHRPGGLAGCGGTGKPWSVKRGA